MIRRTASTASSLRTFTTWSAPSSRPISQAVVARAGQDDRRRAQRLGHRDAEQADRSRPQHGDAFARHQPAEFGQSVHRGAGGHHQRRLGVRHAVGDGDQRVDVVDGVFGEAAIGGEAVGAMALVHLAVVQAVVEAGGVHALAAALALAAAGMDLHGDALADAILVHARAERRDGAHVFVAGREVLVERLAAADHRRRTVRDDLQVGGADRHGIDAHQHLGAARHRHRLLHQAELAGIVQHPGLHLVRDWKIRLVLTKGPEYIAACLLIRLTALRCFCGSAVSA